MTTGRGPTSGGSTRARPLRARRLDRHLTLEDLRQDARRRVPRSVFDFVDGAAEAETSYGRSREAFERVEFVPRVLRDVSQVETATTVLGRPASAPIILAPTGFTRLMHHQGEVAVARAAATAGLPYVVSTLSTTPPSDLVAAVPSADTWFQLYLLNDREGCSRLLVDAAAAGYRTLVLTVDAPVAGARLRDVRNGMTIPPRLNVRSAVDVLRFPTWWFHLLTSDPLTFVGAKSTEGTVADLVNRVFDPRATFDDLGRVRDSWAGKLVVKGIQTPGDAVSAVERGADAIVVSNHGGRQLDRSVTPFDELPAIADAVSGRVEVYVDGGIMRGSDVVACLARGADACLVGRGYLYGLMAGGEAGVDRTLHILKSEMQRTMQLLGLTSVDAITPDSVRLRGV